MYIQSISPLISSVLLFCLTIVTISSGRKSRIWKTFSLFTLMMSLASFIVFLASSGLSNLYPPLKNLIPALPFLSFYSLYFAIYYAYLLVNENDQFRIGRFTITISNYSYIGITLWTVIILIITRSNYFYEDFSFSTDPFKVNFKIGPLYYFFIVIYLSAVGKVIYFLTKAYRVTKSKVKKTFLKFNIFGFFFVYFPAILFSVILPNTGMEAKSYVFIAMPTAVTLFYIAIFRYQFSLVEDLNDNLEKKVEEKTEQLKKTQLRVYQAEKMAALGNLTAGIFHELNNPIGALNASADIIHRLVPHFEKVVPSPDFEKKLLLMKDNSENIIQSSQRISNLLKELKQFSQLDTAEFQTFDINRAIDNNLLLLNHKLDNITIFRKLEGKSKVWCSPFEINQVLTNLFLNSIEAIGANSGSIHVTTQEKENNFTISIKDTGNGISRENIEKIFDPGFTTKGVGVGTGLGLAITYNTIKRHRGEIFANSPCFYDYNPPTGTEIVIKIPIRPGKAIL